MSRLFFLALTVCTLSACVLAPSTPQPTPLVTDVDPEEYALYSAMIDQDVVGYDPEAPFVVIRVQTSPDINHLEFALKGPHKLPKDLVEAYRLRNDRAYTLDASFAPQRGYALMPQVEYAKLAQAGSPGFDEFESKYPGAKGVFFFSRAGLNAARDRALVSMSYYCGSMCAEGGVFLMVKEDGVWKVEQEVAGWEA